MRALCGSIIVAGALIGLGLTALGFGTRFQSVLDKHPEGSTFHNVYYGAPSMTIILVTLLCAVVIGLGIAFLGLAYHHERRTWERQQAAGESGRPRVSV
jgi:hypothetical protein